MSNNYSQSISLPVLSNTSSDAATGAPSGGLATGYSKISGAVDMINLDPESLYKAVESIQKVVSEIKGKAEVSRSVILSELQLELGVSASGKVGIIGIGADLQCAAKLLLTFKAC